MFIIILALAIISANSATIGKESKMESAVTAVNYLGMITEMENMLYHLRRHFEGKDALPAMTAMPSNKQQDASTKKMKSKVGKKSSKKRPMISA